MGLACSIAICFYHGYAIVMEENRLQKENLADPPNAGILLDVRPDEEVQYQLEEAQCYEHLGLQIILEPEKVFR